MKSLFFQPLFSFGLLLRITLILMVVPYASSNWYVPFIDISLDQISFDPWKQYISSGGEVLAFPYGYVMWFFFLPVTMLMKLIGGNLLIGYGLTIMVAEILMLLVLRQLINCTDKLLLATFWLSPVVIFASYWLGLNDTVPVLFLMIALLGVRRKHGFFAGLLCGAAISAKLSMILAIPLFVIYLFQNRSQRFMLKSFGLGLAISCAVLGLPFLASNEALMMLLNNPEMAKVYRLAIPVGPNQNIFVLPLVYFLALYAAWRVRRISFDLMFVLLGIVFFLVFLLTPASPGWVLWVAPLLVYFQAAGGKKTIGLVTLFSVLYLAVAFLASPQPKLLSTEIPMYLSEEFKVLIGGQGESILHTSLMALGIVLVVRLWRETVNRNDYYRISRKPLVVGISGEEGSGKSTLANSLIGLFGKHSCVHIRSEDYRLWDKNKPMWNVLSFLNPRASDLERFSEDVIALADGKSIQTRQLDDDSGVLSKPHIKKSNDFIIVTGLHALYQPILRQRFDLTVFLDIDSEVWSFFNKHKAIDKESASAQLSQEVKVKDREQFLSPQARAADLFLSIKPIHKGLLRESGGRIPPRFKLQIRSNVNLHADSFVRVLVGVCGLHVDTLLRQDSTKVEMTIEGEVSSEDIEMATYTLMPDMDEILDVSPKWEEGVKGLIQLIVLSHMNQALRRRFL